MTHNSEDTPVVVTANGPLMIPRHVFLNSELTYAEKLVYGALFLILNERSCCSPNNQEISSVSGVRIRTVERAVPRLAKAGLIKISGGQNHTRRLGLVDDNRAANE